jgi:hypothetical protein
MATKSLKTYGEIQIQNITGQTANDTLVIPAGYSILGISVVNTTANAVTGGIRIGTTDGGTDVVVALATAANAVIGVPDATILKKLFSTSVDTTLFIQAVVAWNSASVDTNIVIVKTN